MGNCLLRSMANNSNVCKGPDIRIVVRDRTLQKKNQWIQRNQNSHPNLHFLKFGFSDLMAFGKTTSSISLTSFSLCGPRWPSPELVDLRSILPIPQQPKRFLEILSGRCFSVIVAADLSAFMTKWLHFCGRKQVFCL